MANTVATLEGLAVAIDFLREEVHILRLETQRVDTKVDTVALAINLRLNGVSKDARVQDRETGRQSGILSGRLAAVLGGSAALGFAITTGLAVAHVFK